VSVPALIFAVVSFGKTASCIQTLWMRAQFSVTLFLFRKTSKWRRPRGAIFISGVFTVRRISEVDS